MRKSWSFVGLTCFVALVAGIYLAFTPAPQAQDGIDPTPQSSAQAFVQHGMLEPVLDAAALNAPSVSMSPGELEALQIRKLQLREQMASRVQAAAGPAGPPLVKGHEVIEQADTQFHGAPSTFVIGRNNRNTNADNAGNSTLEPIPVGHWQSATEPLHEPIGIGS